MSHLVIPRITTLRAPQTSHNEQQYDAPGCYALAGCCFCSTMASVGVHRKRGRGCLAVGQRSLFGIEWRNRRGIPREFESVVPYPSGFCCESVEGRASFTHPQHWPNPSCLPLWSAHWPKITSHVRGSAREGKGRVPDVAMYVVWSLCRKPWCHDRRCPGCTSL